MSDDVLAKFKENVGKEIGVSDWVEVKQDRINQFAECTGDHQWIHVNEEMAAKGPFGKTIAHGYLTLSMIPALQSSMKGGTRSVPEGLKVIMGVNYGLNKVRLINPVVVDSKIRTRAVLTDVVEKGNGRYLMTTTHTIEIDGQEKPACIAETLSMIMTA